MTTKGGVHIGHQVLTMMDRLGMTPVPRNYNLCYACISNNNQKLRAAMRQLGSAPTQRQLDDLIEEFLPETTGTKFMRRQQEELLKNVDSLLSLIARDASEVEIYTGAVKRVSDSLSKQKALGKLTTEMVNQVAGAIEEAGDRKVDRSNQHLNSVSNHKDEMDRLRNEIAALTLKANTDELTQLYNRRYFDETLATWFDADDRSGLALIMLDIDFFKKINDTYGHSGGDKILRRVADCVKTAIRHDAFVARTGGEEFAVVLRKSGLNDSQVVAERIRKAVEDMEFPSRPGERPLKITVSVGVAMADVCESPGMLYESADQALYRSKHNGRNTVTLFHALNNTSSERYKIYGNG
jgi:diguanylate cyclase